MKILSSTSINQNFKTGEYFSSILLIHRLLGKYSQVDFAEFFFLPFFLFFF